LLKSSVSLPSKSSAFLVYIYSFGGEKSDFCHNSIPFSHLKKHFFTAVPSRHRLRGAHELFIASSLLLPPGAPGLSVLAHGCWGLMGVHGVDGS
jgi:hypothetical protein